MRRALASISSVVAVLGLLIGAPSGAQAAGLGTVTVDYDGSSWSISPNSLAGEVGDTFLLINERNSANNDPTTFVSLQNDSGAVSDSGGSCSNVNSCAILDKTSAPRNSSTFTITSAGVLKVMRSLSGVVTQIGTLTISASSAGSAVVSDPSLVYPTAYLNANGGTCTGQMQFTKYNGQNGTVTLPTGETCTRSGYTLSGWARAADATTSAFASGSTVPIGDESFALYAVWSPTGVEVTYDANVAASDQCLASGVNTGVRTTTSVVAVGSATATSAPCTPLGMVLAGWATAGDGDVAVQPGGALPAEWTSGSSHRLYAKWKVTYGVSITSAPSTMAPNSFSSITVLVQDNDSPARYVAVGATAAGSMAFGDPTVSIFGSTSRVLGVAADGTETIPIYSGAAGTGTITVFYGNSSSSVTITVAEPVAKAITLTGERMTVSGKPGIRVEGVTTGFAAGERVVPYFRFPGQTEYSQGSARPVVDADGEFFWERKTGKKIYVFFTSEDGSVTSDRIIIQAK